MDRTVDVSIPVEAEVAGSLADARTREAVGRVVSRMLKPTQEFDPLLAAVSALSAEAERRGVTDELVDEELAAYSAEGREGDGRRG